MGQDELTFTTAGTGGGHGPAASGRALCRGEAGARGTAGRAWLAALGPEDFSKDPAVTMCYSLVNVSKTYKTKS